MPECESPRPHVVLHGTTCKNAHPRGRALIDLAILLRDEESSQRISLRDLSNLINELLASNTMRLLKTGAFVSENPPTLELHELRGRKERYVALSHTWGSVQDEVLFADLSAHCDPAIRRKEGFICINLDREPAASLKEKPGWAKLAFALEQAYEDGKDWLWIDTICIDRSSSAELAEAVNSAYDIYEASAICYAFLADVPLKEWREMIFQESLSSRWFTRGWTLPELIAPGHVVFYSSEWARLGDKHELRSLLSKVTNIDIAILDGTRSVEHECVARRMSWAARRETTLQEDRAYSLMGLFGVNMPVLYGEGARKAFLRLQEEIIRDSADHSIFAWKDPDIGDGPHGLLADSPKAFTHSSGYDTYTYEEQLPFGVNNRGVQINLHLSPGKKKDYRVSGYTENDYIATLQCPNSSTTEGFLGIYLRKMPSGDRQYARIRSGEITSLDTRGKLEQIFVRQTQPKLGFSTSSSSLANGALQDRSPRNGLPPPPLPQSAKDGVYPIHIFHLNKFRTWDGYEILDVQFHPTRFSIEKYGDLKAELKHPPNVPEKLPVTFKMVKGAHRLTAAILVGFPDNPDKRVVILLGSASSCEPGFDIVECRDLDALKACARAFETMSFGTMAFGRHHRVTVKAETLVKNDVKVYLIELGVGALEKALTRDDSISLNGNGKRMSSSGSSRMSWIVQRVGSIRRHSQLSQ